MKYLSLSLVTTELELFKHPPSGDGSLTVVPFRRRRPSPRIWRRRRRPATAAWRQKVRDPRVLLFHQRGGRRRSRVTWPLRREAGARGEEGNYTSQRPYRQSNPWPLLPPCAHVSPACPTHAPPRAGAARDWLALPLAMMTN